MIQKIHELFHPKGFFAALWPYRYSSIFFTHCNSTSRKCRIIYTIVTVSVAVSSFYFLGNNFYEIRGGNRESRIHNASAILQYWIYFCVVPIHVLTWFFVGHNCYMEIVKSLTAIDRDLVHICCRHVNLRMMVIRQIFCIVLSVSITLMLDISCILVLSQKMNWWQYVEIGIVMNSGMITNLVMTFFGNLVHCTGDRYALINSVLIGIDGIKKVDQISSKVDSDAATLTRQLRIIHRKLFFVSKMIMKAFGLQSVVTVLAGFVSTIDATFNLYKIGVLSCIEIRAQIISILVLQIVSDLSIVIYSAYCCHRTLKEANRTTKILNSLQISSDDIRLEVSTFSCQLMHYELHFSPLGFFNLDLALIQNVIGSVATYLVILVQLESLVFDCL